MKTFVFIFFSIITVKLFAQDYNASLIPESVRKGADVINRKEEYVLTIKSPSKYILYEKHVYTILNSVGDVYAKYRTFYDKMNTINSATGRLFDADGKELKHSKKSDWKDYSAYDGFSLQLDSRYKENEFYSSKYPFTVEYEEEDESNGTLHFPHWMPQRYCGMAVQSSKFTIIAPSDYIVRYKQFNLKTEPVITQKGDTKIYTWEIKNIIAKKNEVNAPPFEEITPSVYFAPSEFEVEGYKGNMSSWNGYGNFMYQLIKGRDILPAEIITKIHELIDKLSTNKEKIYALYDFLQKNTRYISVQLGIGGWQPFEASYVAQKKYGDCKALSNYMIALLKEAGITGKYIEIYAGRSAPVMVDDFPCSQANHVISCVPLEKDTIWLECTSQTVSPGYMGSFTGNRKAILIDENGGRIVNTPVYNAADNIQLRLVKAEADNDGNLKADLTNSYSGLQQDLPHSLMYDASKEDREKYLNRMFSIPTYKVINSSYNEHKGIIPSMDEQLQIELNKYANITGKRLFINPNIFGSISEKLSEDTSRQYDYIIKDSYRDIDSVEIKIPTGYKAESIPKNNELVNTYGKYVSSVKVTDDKIIYYRLMEQTSGRIPAKEFNDLVKFYEQVNKADRSKVVLVKTE